jgi:exosortase
MEAQPTNGILEEFRIDFLDSWQRLPNKGLFLMLLAAWLALFQFLGNSTLGYVNTASLFSYMVDDFSSGGHWDQADDSYGVAVPFVVLVVFWLKRRELTSLELKSWSPALIVVALGLVLHLLGFRIQQPRISVLGMFTGVYGLMGLAWGPKWLRASLYPFCLFAFCVPMGSLAIPLTFRLQLLVTKLVEVVCQFGLMIDVIREGTQLSDPTGSYHYEVAAACSGIHSLVATLGLAVVLSFYSLPKWGSRLLMIAAAFPLAVLGNLLRMLAIVIAAEFGGQSWGNWVHDGGPFGTFSLLPYVPAFLGLLWLEGRLREHPQKLTASARFEAKAI